MTVASRVAVMDEGRIKQVATPATIYEAPNSVYVADFIGDVTLLSGPTRARPTTPNATEKAPPQSATPESAPTQSAPPQSAPAPAAQGTAQVPQPNDLGIWLHDKLLHYVLGPRKEPPRQLPPPKPETQSAQPQSPSKTSIPDGGLEIAWADGQPPLIAANGDPALAGQTVNLALRPEKVAISKVKPQAPNVLPGKVIDIAYLGNISTYHVELAGGQMIKAQRSNTRRRDRQDITWEDPVWISWSATAGVVLAQ